MAVLHIDFDTILECIFANARLGILPQSFISDLFRFVDTFSPGTVVVDIAFVVIPILEDVPAWTCRLALNKLSLEVFAIRKEDFAVAIRLAIYPLA